MKDLASTASAMIASYSNRLEHARITNGKAEADLLSRLRHFDFRSPVRLESLVEEVNDLLFDFGFHVPHPGYFGLYNPATSEASVIAEALVALYNPQLAVASHAPAATAIEQHVLGFFTDRLGYDRRSAFSSFTTGGSEANHTAVLVALASAFPDYLGNGLSGVTARPVIYASSAAHNSFDKIVKNVGLGTRALRRVPVDSSLRLDVAALERQIETDVSDGYHPLALVATAGTTGSGAIDPLTGLAEVARRYGMWYHVDAAWAGAAIISPRLRGHLQGIELSDSVTIDAHKWLSVSMGAGMFFSRHTAPVRMAFNIPAEYMPSHLQNEPYLTTIQWSRKFIGLRLFLALAQHSVDGLASQIEYQCELSDRLALKLRRSGWLIVNDSPVAVLNFTHPSIMSGRVTAAQIQKQLEEEGDSWISTLPLATYGQVLRTCITSIHTRDAHTDKLVDRLNRLVN